MPTNMVRHICPIEDKIAGKLGRNGAKKVPLLGISRQSTFYQGLLSYLFLSGVSVVAETPLFT